MQRRFFRFLALAWIVVACGGDDDRKPLVMCGDETCNARQTCDDAAMPAQCVCQKAYAGTACDECAEGYVASDPVQGASSTCMPIPIDCDQEPCGDYGSCVEDERGDRCECSENHAGPTCAQCETGFQDNDLDGTCTPSCAGASSDCESWEQCVDESGTAMCGCAENTTGRHCDECTEDRYRLGDGPCVKSCVDLSGATSCSDPTVRCKEIDGEDAICACPFGSALDTDEAACSCEEGFEGTGGSACARVPSRGMLLVAQSEPRAHSYSNYHRILSAFDPQTKELTPLRQGFPPHLAADLTRNEFWANGRAGFGRYDIVAGEVEELPTTIASDYDNARTFDSKRNAVFWLRRVDGPEPAVERPVVLHRYDVQGGETAEVAEIGFLSGPLAYDPANDRLLLADLESSNYAIFAIDPDTGATSSLGELDPAPTANLSNPGFTVDAAGTLYILLASRLTEEEELRTALTTITERLDIDPIITDDSPVSLQRRYDPDTSVTIELVETQSSGAEVVGYDSYGDDAEPEASPIYVSVKNPDAIVSITSFEEKQRITIASDAVFARMVIDNLNGSIELIAEAGFEAEPGTIVVTGGADAFSPDTLEAVSPAVRVYTDAAWRDRRLEHNVYFTGDTQAPNTTLARIDPQTLKWEALAKLRVANVLTAF